MPPGGGRSPTRQVGVSNWQTIAVVNCQKMVRGGWAVALQFVLMASTFHLGPCIRWMTANRVFLKGYLSRKKTVRFNGDLMEYQDYVKDFGCPKESSCVT